MRMPSLIKCGADGVAFWLRSFVVPDVCVRCGRHAPQHALCATCCQEAMAEGACATPLPPGLSRMHIGMRLSEPVRALVHGLKYQGQRHHAKLLVDMAAPRVRTLPKDALLVPVPVHVTRRRERGYNQSLLLAEAWCKMSGHVVSDCLERVRATGSQTRLDASARRRNLEASLRVNRRLRTDVPLILVDDICTTGSTLSACASVLLAAGAHDVQGLACAWSPGA